MSVTIRDGLAQVEFRAPFDLERYSLFLKSKRLPESQVIYDWESDAYTLTTPARFAPLLGGTLERHTRKVLPLAEHLFDYQRFFVDLALDIKRYAFWWETGTGKGPAELEWARQVASRTGGKVLILVPTLELIAQLREEAERFYGGALDLQVQPTREALITWCKSSGQAIGICTYAKLIPGEIHEFRFLAGIAADEASILKSGGGVIKWNLIHSAKGVEYKLSLTATPAPNETLEYASQGSFLEKLRDEGEIIWTFFKKTKTGDWTVKPLALPAFYRFMASWSIYLRDPAHFGFGDILADLPAPELHEYTLPLTDVQRELMHGLSAEKSGGLWAAERMGMTERSKLSQLAKGFLYGKQGTARIESHKPAFVADLVRQEMRAGRQVLVWTVFDEESDIVREALGTVGSRVAVLNGAMNEEQRAEVLLRFRRGDLDVLLSKAQLVGFGMNFQFCRSMIFSGFDDSFERAYQAVRRAYRFGQTETVHVHWPVIPELEGLVYQNVRAKEAAFERDVTEMERHYRTALAEILPDARLTA